jgi:hypothetical protein
VERRYDEELPPADASGTLESKLGLGAGADDPGHRRIGNRGRRHSRLHVEGPLLRVGVRSEYAEGSQVGIDSYPKWVRAAGNRGACFRRSPGIRGPPLRDRSDHRVLAGRGQRVAVRFGPPNLTERHTGSEDEIVGALLVGDFVHPGVVTRLLKPPDSRFAQSRRWPSSYSRAGQRVPVRRAVRQRTDSSPGAPRPAQVRHFPREVSPIQGNHAIWIASSAHTPMQCSSLPHASGRVRTASPLDIPRQAGPQALTQSPQPEHLSSSMTGIHLCVGFMMAWRTQGSAAAISG